MKISRTKIKLEYRKELKDYHRDIDSLDSEDRSNGIKNPKQELEKIKKSEQEEAKMMPVAQDLVQDIQNQQVFTAGMQNFMNQQSNNGQTQEKKSDDQDWLNDILLNTQTAMNEAYHDPDMQQFMKDLGGNSGFNYDDFS